MIRLIACGAFLTLIATSVWAAEPAADGHSGTDLTELSLEELMNTETTSVSKKAERLSEAAAASAI